MDERSRSLERAVARGRDDAMARVRLANERLRAGDPRGALASLEPAHPDEPGVVATTRALAHVRAGASREALEALEVVVAAGRLDLEPAALVEGLGPALEGRVPLGRPRAARVVARVARASSSAGIALTPLLATLGGDEDPLVRLALRAERPAPEPQLRTRVYGSHGADYEVGRLIVFEAGLEMRLRTFEPRLFSAVGTALSALADDATALEALAFVPAGGLGYGLGGKPHEVQADLVEGAVDRLNALDLLPWRLRVERGDTPYDVLEEPRRLTRWLARDLESHLGRQRPYDPAGSCMARLLALNPLRGETRPSREQLSPVLEEAQREFTSIGFAACEEFLVRVRQRPRF